MQLESGMSERWAKVILHQVRLEWSVESLSLGDWSAMHDFEIWKNACDFEIKMHF